MTTTVFFDFETGGVQDHHPNIQLAAVAVDADWNEIGTFERKIIFNEADADPEALEMNHYDPEVWKREAVPACATVAEFAAFLRPFCCVQRTSRRGTSYYVARTAGHNAATFDGPRLRRMFAEAGTFLPTEMFVRCTLQRALWWFDEHMEDAKSLRLTEIAKYFGIPTEGAHDALKDVRLSIAIARHMAAPVAVEA